MIKTVKKFIEDYIYLQKLIEQKEFLSSLNEELDDEYWDKKTKKIKYINFIIDNFKKEEKELFKGFYLEEKTSKDFYLSESAFYYQVRKVSEKFIEKINNITTTKKIKLI